MKTAVWIVFLAFGILAMSLGLSEIRTSPYHTFLGLVTGGMCINAGIQYRRRLRTASAPKSPEN